MQNAALSRSETYGSVVTAGEGVADFPELLQRLRADGYDGFLSLEPHLISPLGCRDEALHWPLFLEKLIEELRGFARFVRTPFAPGKRLSRWSSLDQAPQEGY